jgi:hypothetical protein
MMKVNNQTTDGMPRQNSRRSFLIGLSVQAGPKLEASIFLHQR